MRPCIDLIGSGAVAQYLCRELTAKGNSVRLHVPQYRRNDDQQQALLADLSSLPWMQVLTPRHDQPSTIRLFAGTPEQFFSYQHTKHHQESSIPLLLLTSWWMDLKQLEAQLCGPVIPAYPRITVESWKGRLASFGALRIELPNDLLASSVSGDDVSSALTWLGLDYDLMPMQKRFKSRFMQTSFAYWYALSRLKPTTSRGQTIDHSEVQRLWDSLFIHWESQPDLQVPLSTLEIGIQLMYRSDPALSDPAWILHVLLHHKPAKLHYFLSRSGLLLNTASLP